MPFPWLGKGKLPSYLPTSSLTAAQGSSRPRGPDEENLGPPAPARVTRGTQPISQPSAMPQFFPPPLRMSPTQKPKSRPRLQRSAPSWQAHTQKHIHAPKYHTLVFRVLPGGEGWAGLWQSTGPGAYMSAGAIGWLISSLVSMGVSGMAGRHHI